MSILAIGSVALDTITAPGGRVEETVGGSVTYFSLAASLFSPVAAVGVIGEDFPAHALDLLRERGVDCAALERKEGKTFRWCGRYEDVNVALTEATDLGVFADFKPYIPPAYRNRPYVFLGNIDPVLQLEVLDQVARPKLVALDTMNYWIERQRGDLARVIPRVDVLIVNDAEARMLGEDRNLMRAVDNLLQWGPRFVVAKKGEHGVILMGRDCEFTLPAYMLREVADPTGAGDTFAGGFIGYLAATDDVSPPNLCRAVACGTTVASFTCEGLGVGRLASLTREEVQQRLARFSAMTRF